MSNRLITAHTMVAGVAVLTSAVGCRIGPSQAFAPKARAPGGVPIILDTDIGTDVDDAGALAMLHTLAPGMRREFWRS